MITKGMITNTKISIGFSPFRGGAKKTNGKFYKQNAYRMAAQSLVNIFDDTTYYGEIYLPEGGNARKGRAATISKNRIESKLKVYPNPARDFVTIEFEISEVLHGAELAIINQQGKLIQSFNITQNQNYRVLQTTGYSSGIYHIVLRNNSSVIKSATVSIITK